MKASRIKNPSGMIAIADSRGEPDGTEEDDFTIGASRIDFEYGRAPGAIHNRGANVLFCDGHVQWFEQQALLADDKFLRWPNLPAVRRMWNRDNKP